MDARGGGLLDGGLDAPGVGLLDDGLGVALRDKDDDASGGRELLQDELDSAWRFESAGEVRSQSILPLEAEFPDPGNDCREPAWVSSGSTAWTEATCCWRAASPAAHWQRRCRAGRWRSLKSTDSYPSLHVPATTVLRTLMFAGIGLHAKVGLEEICKRVCLTRRRIRSSRAALRYVVAPESSGRRSRLQLDWLAVGAWIRVRSDP